jgi:hypothetical protein
MDSSSSADSLSESSVPVAPPVPSTDASSNALTMLDPTASSSGRYILIGIAVAVLLGVGALVYYCRNKSKSTTGKYSDGVLPGTLGDKFDGQELAIADLNGVRAVVLNTAPKDQSSPLHVRIGSADVDLNPLHRKAFQSEPKHNHESIELVETIQESPSEEL